MQTRGLHKGWPTQCERPQKRQNTTHSAGWLDNVGVWVQGLCRWLAQSPCEVSV
jgi:hypothetical protein